MGDKRENLDSGKGGFSGNAGGSGSNRPPVLYEKKEDCCGCSACYSICPVGAISMEPDEEGFLYPVIDSGKCVCCHQCESVCVFKK